MPVVKWKWKLIVERRIELSHIDIIKMIRNLNKLSILYQLQTFKAGGVIRYITKTYFNNFSKYPK